LSQRKKPWKGQPPASWINWEAQTNGREARGGAEFALYTDSHPTNEIRTGLGPYSLLNTIPAFADETGDPGAAPVPREPKPLILRVSDHLFDQADPVLSLWLPNSSIDHELSGLISLTLGRRIKAGGLTRRFYPDGDPAGEPFEYGHRRPYLPQGDPILGWQLPMLRGQVELMSAQPRLATYGGLEPQEAAMLARAARGYADAIWIAEGDPQEAWIRLVGAIEAAAGFWGYGRTTPLAAVAESMPDLPPLLAQVDDDLSRQIAEVLETLTGSGARFADFLMTYLPPEPQLRPEYGLLDWTNLRPGLAKIYNARSKALHVGTPIPWGMCMAPRPDSGTWMEKIFEGATFWHDGEKYTSAQTPMLLHTFAFIVRGALLNWWEDMAPATVEPATAPNPSEAAAPDVETAG